MYAKYNQLENKGEKNNVYFFRWETFDDLKLDV